MPYKVVTTARSRVNRQTGSISREHRFADEPKTEDLNVLRREAQDEYQTVYNTGATVDIAVRRS